MEFEEKIFGCMKHNSITLNGSFYLHAISTRVYNAPHASSDVQYGGMVKRREPGTLLRLYTYALWEPLSDSSKSEIVPARQRVYCDRYPHPFRHFLRIARTDIVQEILR
jgi:hypothetical protein